MWGLDEVIEELGMESPDASKADAPLLGTLPRRRKYMQAQCAYWIENFGAQHGLHSEVESALLEPEAVAAMTANTSEIIEKWYDPALKSGYERLATVLFEIAVYPSSREKILKSLTPSNETSLSYEPPEEQKGPQ